MRPCGTPNVFLKSLLKCMSRDVLIFFIYIPGHPLNSFIVDLGIIALGPDKPIPALNPWLRVVGSGGASLTHVEA